MEIWRDIPGFEGRYQASTHGRLRSLDRTVLQRDRVGRLFSRLEKGALIAAHPTKAGYLRIFSRELSERSVSRLVALTFVDNPEEKPEVNHLDGDRTNNTPGNLEWATCSENQQHAYRVLGRKPSTHGEKPVVVFIAERFALHFESFKAAATMLGTSRQAVRSALHHNHKVKGFSVEYV